MLVRIENYIFCNPETYKTSQGSGINKYNSTHGAVKLVYEYLSEKDSGKDFFGLYFSVGGIYGRSDWRHVANLVLDAYVEGYTKVFVCEGSCVPDNLRQLNVKQVYGVPKHILHKWFFANDPKREKFRKVADEISALVESSQYSDASALAEVSDCVGFLKSLVNQKFL